MFGSASPAEPIRGGIPARAASPPKEPSGHTDFCKPVQLQSRGQPAAESSFRDPDRAVWHGSVETSSHARIRPFGVAQVTGHCVLCNERKHSARLGDQFGNLYPNSRGMARCEFLSECMQTLAYQRQARSYAAHCPAPAQPGPGPGTGRTSCRDSGHLHAVAESNSSHIRWNSPRAYR
jgi:hypothetical protein